jgi:C-terminal processing protease CtpA/Prc
VDFEVGTIHTMYYDPTGGAYFEPREFVLSARRWLRSGEAAAALRSRSGAEAALRETARSLGDPYSRYLTREELKQELVQESGGFLGLGAVVEPSSSPGGDKDGSSAGRILFGYSTAANPVLISNPQSIPRSGLASKKDYLPVADAVTLPVVAAVAPDSAAERDGVTVGDRVVSVTRSDSDISKRGELWSREVFLGKTRGYVSRRLDMYNQQSVRGKDYELTLAKPIVAIAGDRDVVVGYRTTRMHVSDASPSDSPKMFNHASGETMGGKSSLVHYEVLRDTIFRHATLPVASGDQGGQPTGAISVGYIRLTRFSRAATAQFVKAIEALEKAGASSLIIDLRNNYGGIIQEAMLTASSLLRDPHLVLCYTINSRGGFTPHEVEEYVVDTRYPGYLFGNEARDSTLRQVRRERPSTFEEDGIMWVPPTSFLSLHEQRMKLGIHRPTSVPPTSMTPRALLRMRHEKQIVLLVNEGTASSAEVFASALRDNGRTVAVVGTKTFGKGIIQHTFPMPDGGGLRLTVAEYLTPSLRHVTHVGGAQFDPRTGERIGGGIKPDIYCESKQGIPGNIGADLCVGMALDALEESDSFSEQQPVPFRLAATRNDGTL